MNFFNLLLQIPSNNIYQYTTQVLGVILALLDDLDESVQLTSVSCLLMVILSISFFLCFFSYVSSPGYLASLLSGHIFPLILDSWVINQWCCGTYFAESFCAAPKSSSAFIYFLWSFLKNFYMIFCIHIVSILL